MEPHFTAFREHGVRGMLGFAKESSDNTLVNELISMGRVRQVRRVDHTQPRLRGERAGRVLVALSLAVMLDSAATQSAVSRAVFETAASAGVSVYEAGHSLYNLGTDIKDAVDPSSKPPPIVVPKEYTR